MRSTVPTTRTTARRTRVRRIAQSIGMRVMVAPVRGVVDVVSRTTNMMMMRVRLLMQVRRSLRP